MADHDKFTGMIVAPGSVSDGKTVGRATPYLRLPGAMATPTRLTTKKVPTNEPMVVEQFVWVPDAGGLWVPDNRDAAWGIETLRAGYRRGK